MAQASAGTKVEKRVILNLDRCISCRSCSAACYYGHRGMPNVSFGVIEEGTLPLICRQCEEPACVDVCPVDALRKEPNGVTVRSRMLCIGCMSCVYACPFGVISPQLTLRTVAKCDYCEDLISEGGTPRCVSACPAGALDFRSCDELSENAPLLLSGRMVGRDQFKRR
jgi:Fe-S-cluster-containing dehydrogenase component